MSTLEFDPSKSFDEHMQALRRELEIADPELAAIFFANLDKLSGESDASQIRASRTAFNKAVIEQLNALLPKGGSD
jgi:hypothetical protein